MKPSQILLSLETLITIRQPGFLWGSPGVGKSEVVAQVARKLGLEVIDVRAVLLDPVDLRGLPHISETHGGGKGDKRAQWCPPGFLPRQGQGGGILFLDELNVAPPLVQGACYQLILDRQLGEYRLPEGWTILAAGNRETDRAVTHRMPSALANRLVHLEFEVDLEDWICWAMNNDIQAGVIAFIRFRPNLLQAFDSQKGEKAFPSPRSWEFVSRILTAKPDPDVEYDLISGTVGEGAAAEFIGFMRIYRDLPDPDAVLMSPDTAEVPKAPATMYAVCEVLARKASQETMDPIVRYANRLPAEFGVLLIRNSVKNDTAVVDTPAFDDWARTHCEILI